MALGRSLCLDADSQRTLALWANKTAHMLLGAFPAYRAMLPDSHRSAVHNWSPAPETVVDYFPWSGGPVIAHITRTVVTGSDEVRFYRALLTFRHVGFIVTGLQTPLPAGAQLAHDSSPYMVPLWPQEATLVTWPPGPAIDNRLLPELLAHMPARTG